MRKEKKLTSDFMFFSISDEALEPSMPLGPISLSNQQGMSNWLYTYLNAYPTSRLRKWLFQKLFEKGAIATGFKTKHKDCLLSILGDFQLEKVLDSTYFFSWCLEAYLTQMKNYLLTLHLHGGLICIALHPSRRDLTKKTT